MATYGYDDVELHYEVHGEGFPVLLIAPGGMMSSIRHWENAPWNPIQALSSDYRVIAMDQRNAGQSRGPISGDDGWSTYTRDQLALLDHLGVDQFHVAGMCIGGPYIMGLIQAAPERVASAVLFQTIGLTDNQQAFYEMFDNWAGTLKDSHPEVTAEDWDRFRNSMFGGDKFLFNVDQDFVKAISTPLLVLRGNDLYHPEASSRELAGIAQNVTFVEHWKEPQHLDSGREAVAGFLREFTPRS